MWRLSEVLIWTKRVSRPCSPDSRSEKKSAKKPRWPSNFSSSHPYAPGKDVSSNFIRTLLARRRYKSVDEGLHRLVGHRVEAAAKDILSSLPVPSTVVR
jgi:hypothetical protein